MKKISLAVVAIGFAFLATSCKKETTVVTDTEGENPVVVQKEVTLDDNVQAEINNAEARYNQAEADLKAAIERGDKQAEEAARKVRDEAKRSEEHTSELQSRENLVCRLLL